MAGTDVRADDQLSLDLGGDLLPDYTKLPRFTEPTCDNQRLMNLQYEYYNGNPAKIEAIYMALNPIAAKLLRCEMKKQGLHFDHDKMRDLATDATIFFIEQIEKNRLVIKTSFVAYMRLQVLKALYSETEGEKFERWCISHGYDIMNMPAEDALYIKYVLYEGKPYEKEKKLQLELFQPEAV